MNIPRYTDCVPSGLPMIGNVPRHWRKTALKYLGEYQNGYPFKPEDWGDTGLPIVRIAQLSGQAEPNYFAGNLDDRVRVENGDLLFSWSATIDSFIWTSGSAWLNQHIFKVTPSDEAEKSFLYYVIKHIAPKLADFDAHGSTMRHIKKESLGERLFVPDRSEQRDLATFLDRETAKIDALVEEQRRLIELLREKRQAVISQAVTKGLDPNVPMKHSGVGWVGDVPAHWVVMPIRIAARLESGHTPSRSRPDWWENCTVPWFTLADVWQIRQGADVIYETAEMVSELGLENSSARRLPKGTVMLSRTASVGFSAIMGTDMATTQDFANWVCGERLLPEFLLCVFRSMSGEFRRLMMGSTHNTIYMPDIQAFRFALPPIAEQREIVERVREATASFDGLMDEAKRGVDLLQERRSALISAAVTGKIDVRGLVKEKEPKEAVSA